MEQWYARISTSGRFDCVLLLCFQSIASVTREPLPEHELRGDAAKDTRTEWIIFLRLQCVSANGCATHYCTHIPFSWCKPGFCLPFYPYTTCAVLNIFNVHAWMMWPIKSSCIFASCRLRGESRHARPGVNGDVYLQDSHCRGPERHIGSTVS